MRNTMGRAGLVVGNYCHDVLIRDDAVVAETLGGAASFVANVLDGVSIGCDLVSKVGSDFAYSVAHLPIVLPASPTTLFHAFFGSGTDNDGTFDRVLKRVRFCGAIEPTDLPESRFDFGMAVGVAGEILPETLERMIDLCEIVFVDIQALIRVFDPSDGMVRLVGLRESGFFHLLPRIGFLKASSDEAPYVDLEEARKLCCVLITNGKEGCTLYWKDGKMQIPPFPAVQIDPTGAGDSFLGGFVAGLVQGLTVPDAALLANLFGSMTVDQIGLPKFELKLLQRVNDEVQRRKMQCISCCENGNDDLKFVKPAGHQQFHSSLAAAKLMTSTAPLQECQWDLRNSPPRAAEPGIPQRTPQQKLLLNPVYEDPIQSVEGTQ